MDEKQLEELATEFQKATDQVKGLGEELTGKMANGEQRLDGLKAQVDEALISMNEAKTRLDEVEQKMARRGGAETTEKTYVEQLIESESFKSFAQNPRSGKSTSLMIKSTITSDEGSAGKLVLPQQLQGIIAPPTQALTIRDLIAAGTTTSNAITFIKETGFTNNAAFQQNEGDKKAQSEITFTDETVGVKTIAHYMKASRQILDDAAMLGSYINQRLLYGLKLKEEQQILNGDGSAGGLTGLLHSASEFNDPTETANYSIIDQLRLALLQVVLAGYPANGYVLNPIDWAKIELTKDKQGRHIIGIPQGTAQRTLWGLPVVESQSIAAGTFLTGAFNLGAQLFDRQESSIAIATENEDDFVKNLVTILCEERLALAVYRPEAFVKGTLAPKGK